MPDLTDAKLAAAAVELPEGFHVIVTDNATDPWGPDDDPGIAINISYQAGDVVLGRFLILDWHLDGVNLDERVQRAITSSIEAINTEMGSLSP